MRRSLWALLVPIWLTSLAVPREASASDFGPFRGRVVDAATKEPIEGAVVFVEWRQTHFFAGTTFYDAQETLTDKNGEFEISGIWVLNPWRHLTVYAEAIFYRSGYQAIRTGGFKSWNEINIDLGYVLAVEDGKPTLMLRSLTLSERRTLGTPGSGGIIPDEKKRLIQREINKERRFLGLPEVTF